jgi:hypothetical protein
VILSAEGHDPERAFGSVVVRRQADVVEEGRQLFPVPEDAPDGRSEKTSANLFVYAPAVSLD